MYFERSKRTLDFLKSVFNACRRKSSLGALEEKEGREPPLLSPVSSRFTLVFALSQFSGPNYLGAWKRLSASRTHSPAVPSSSSALVTC